MKIDKILSCGIIPVRYTPAGWKLLVLRAYRNWDFPKGIVEDGEDPLNAAKRETEEETGLTDLDFVWGDEYRETAPYAGNKVARYYAAETREEDITLPVSEELGRPEHHEWRWVTCEEAEDLLPPRLAGVLDWVHNLIEDDRGGDSAGFTEPESAGHDDDGPQS